MKRFLPIAVLLQGCTGEPEEDPVYRGDPDVHLGGEVSCMDPVEGIGRFTEEGSIRGFTVPLEEVDLLGNTMPGIGADLIAKDLDADGDLDLLVGGLYGKPQVYENDGHGYFKMLEPAPIALTNIDDPFTMTYGAVDLNGDLLPEILHGGSGRFGLLVNQGDMKFVEVQAETFGSQDDRPHNTTLALGDVDGDGDLDLFIPTNGPISEGGSTDPESGAPDVLFVLDSERVFTPALTFEVGENGSRSQTATFTDRDGDGDMDLMVLADLGPPSSFFRNDGVDSNGLPVFVDDAEDLSANLQMSAMGIDSADLNQDGQLDYCISDVGPPKCLLSDGAGGYYEGAEALGLVVKEPTGRWGTVGWSVELADLENNGLVDLVHASGPDQWAFANEKTEIPDLIWKQTAAGVFEDVSVETSFNNIANHIGMAAADFNGDGYLDLAVAGPGKVVELHMNQCGSNAWLDVELIGPEGNSEGIGAQISVAWSDRVETREIHSLRAHGQGPSRAHFGFGALEAGVVDQLEVRWPDGHISTAENVPVRRQILVRHPEGVAEKFESNVEAKPFFGEETNEDDILISGEIFDPTTNEMREGFQVWKDEDPESLVQTNGDGLFSIMVPKDQATQLRTTDEGWIEMFLSIHPDHQASPEDGLRFTPIEEARLEDLYLEWTGQAMDPERGTLLIHYFANNTMPPPIGATVELTADYDAVIRIGPDSSAEGNTLQEGEQVILFLNVQASGHNNLPISATTASGGNCLGMAVATARPNLVGMIPLFCP